MVEEKVVLEDRGEFISVVVHEERMGGSVDVEEEG